MQHICLLMLALVPFPISAQNAAYAFDMLTLPYTDILDELPCTFDENGFHRITELDGETIHLMGVPITIGDDQPLHVGDFGFLRVDNDTLLIIVDGLFTFLEQIDATSRVGYAINGPAGQRTLVVQWHNWRLSNGPEDNHAHWQIALEQATGTVEIRIGPNSGGGMLFSDVSGPNCGVFSAPHSFATCHGKVWVEQDAYDPLIDTLPNFDLDALHNLPPPNTVYRFTPRQAPTGMAEALDAVPLRPRLSGNDLWIPLPERLGPVTLYLYDGQGRQVSRSQASPPLARIPMMDLPPGPYVLRVHYDGGNSGVTVVKP